MALPSRRVSPLMAMVGLAVATVLASPAPATAGVVTGKLDLPEPPASGGSTRGYLAPLENPILPVQKLDPRPRLVVVLVGGPTTAPPPSQLVWDLVGDSFARPVLPVRLGAEVLIKNKSPRAVALVARESPDLVPKGTINPSASKTFKPAAAGLLTITDPTLPHLIGRLVVLESPYFAVPDGAGRFEIKDVPAGEWTVRVWYLDGWIVRPDDKISVGSSKVEVNPKVPATYPRKAGA